MSASALSCPRCAGPLAVATSGLVECGACGGPAAVLADDPPRSVLLPRIEAAPALEAARRGLAQQPHVDGRFLRVEAWGAPRLAYAPFYVVERTLTGGGDGLQDSIEVAPAAVLPHHALDAVAPSSVLGRRAAYDPASLRRQALVLDVSESLEHAVPGLTGEERVEIVYMPIWLIESRDGHNVYEVAVDATGGTVLAARAPLDPLARVPQALAIVYGLAIFAASLPLLLDAIVWILAQLELFGLAVICVIVGLLFTLLAWAWDHLRFRHELLVEAGRSRRIFINRPERTGPERLRDGFLRLVKRVVK